jgi:hypothetical protein
MRGLVNAMQGVAHAMQGIAQETLELRQFLEKKRRDI